jgi:predicted Zn-dependent protease with MMP-like domain
VAVHDLSLTQFEKLVAQALRELPESFRSLATNVVIAIEEEPSDEDLEATSSADDDYELFGIYRGPMRTESSFDDLPALPPEIVIFRGPILRETSSRKEAVKEIKDTLVHELGHFFGLKDEEMPC